MQQAVADAAAAYLAIFLPPTKQPTKLFPPIDDPFGEQERTIHEIFTLSDVHFVPLVPDLAKSQVAYLSKIMASCNTSPVLTAGQACTQEAQE